VSRVVCGNGLFGCSPTPIFSTQPANSPSMFPVLRIGRRPPPTPFIVRRRFFFPPFHKAHCVPSHFVCILPSLDIGFYVEPFLFWRGFWLRLVVIAASRGAIVSSFRQCGHTARNFYTPFPCFRRQEGLDQSICAGPFRAGRGVEVLVFSYLFNTLGFCPYLLSYLVRLRTTCTSVIHNSFF